MKVIYAPHFKRSFKSLSKEVKKKFKKQVKFLLRDIHYPSLIFKKIKFTLLNCPWHYLTG